MRKKLLAVSLILSFFIVSFYFANANKQDLDLTVSYFGPNPDINHDGRVDGLDVSALVTAYGTSGEPCYITFREDINRDGTVDGLDVSALVTAYGVTWMIT